MGGSGRSWRRRIGVPAAAVLLSAGGLVVLAAGPAAAAIPSPVDPTIPDGNTNSLRDVLENQVTGGETVVLQSGATYTLDNCSANDINIAATVTIQGNGATIKQTCPTAAVNGVLSTGNDLTIDKTTITGGKSTDAGGGIRAANSGQTIVLTASTVVNNQSDDNGGGMRVIGHLVLDHSTVTGNTATGDGGGIDMDGSGDVVQVTDSTISNNTSTGDDGGGINLDSGGTATFTRTTLNGNTALGGGGAISTEDGIENVTLTNSTVTGNTSGFDGAIEQTSTVGGGSLTLLYDTIAGNITTNTPIDSKVVPGSTDASEPSTKDVTPAGVPAPANVNVFLSTFASFGTVIANPIGGLNCVVPLIVASNGYNFSDDASCGFMNTTTGDRENAGNPGLGPLAANGGPTLTMLPGSPLIDKIPAGSPCGGVNIVVDQRGLPRPTAAPGLCDIGAVEVQLVARFTG